MKVYKHYFSVILGMIPILLTAACSTVPISPNNVNSNAAVVTNSNVVNKITTNTEASPAVANISPPVTTTGGTPSSTVAAYYHSMVKKDEKGFRQVLSRATLNEFSVDARADSEKNLVEYWTGYSSPPKQPYETRNERISGDAALVEIKDSDTAKWSLTKLVRENGEWKLDLTSATVESLLKQQPR